MGITYLATNTLPLVAIKSIIWSLAMGSYLLPMEFCLNRTELSLNSLNSGNLKVTEARIVLNLNILSPHVSCWCCGSIPVSHTRDGCVTGLSPFTVMTNIFVTETKSVKQLGKTPVTSLNRYLSRCREFLFNPHIWECICCQIWSIKWILFWFIEFCESMKVI